MEQKKFSISEKVKRWNVLSVLLWAVACFLGALVGWLLGKFVFPVIFNF